MCEKIDKRNADDNSVFDYSQSSALMLGNGKPLLLIAGAGATMDAWDPMVLKQLSANHTVIIFDNRGIGQTSPGTIKSFSISQYANDTAGLLDALQIGSPVDVLGHSLGSFIAQELTLMHPDKVNKIILFASNCGGKDAIPGTPEVNVDFAKLANPNLTPADQAPIIADLMFPHDLIYFNLTNNNGYKL